MGKYRYVIEAVDVDGDGVPDGDLIKKYEGKKLISQKFVPKTKLKKLAKKVSDANARAENSGVPSPKERVVYKTAPASKAVVVQQKTKFGEYLKMGVGVGAGAEVGRIGVDALFDGLADLF